MSLFGLGKRVTPNKFDYKPRYYDPAKEELDKRLARIKKSPNALDPDSIKERISVGFKYRTGRSEAYRNESRKSNIRVVIILVALLTLSILLINSPKILKLLSYLDGSQF